MRRVNYLFHILGNTKAECDLMLWDVNHEPNTSFLTEDDDLLRVLYHLFV